MDDVTPAPTDRARLRRHPERGRYDRDTVHAVLDEGLLAHVAVVMDGAPRIVPMAYARIGDDLYLHGATGNAVLRAAVDAPVTVTVTLLDGLVLARSAFHHSVNFRSVVVHATGVKVDDDDEKRRASAALVDQVAPGRSAATRPPSLSELRATLVVRLPLAEASAKVRTGPPVDDPDDLALPHWAGVLPLRLTADTAVPDVATPAPPHVTDWRR